jgi:hypothetical protein
MTLSNNSDRLSKFLLDRVRFKLYACQQHLRNLKNIESESGDLASTDARLGAEIEIDCFLSLMIGSVDSLLVELNDKLELGIPNDKVEMNAVKSGILAKTKKIELLEDLDNASRDNNWYWFIRQLRNYSYSRYLILASTNSKGAYLPKNPTSRVNNPDRMNIELIPYLEQSLNQVKELIENIRKRADLIL